MEYGLIVNQKLVKRIMLELQIHGLPQQKKGTRNLVNVATHEDRVNRNFVAERPNALWLTDITEHPTREAKVYCCCVLDLFSRKVVGWAIDRRCESAIVNDALSMAARSRITSPSTVIHSDHGPQGEFKRSSQHLEYGGVYGKTGRMDERTNWASTDEVARIPGTPQRGRERVLASCGHGNHERSSSGSCRRVPSGRHSLVPASWWNATESSCTSFGPVFVL